MPSVRINTYKNESRGFPQHSSWLSGDRERISATLTEALGIEVQAFEIKKIDYVRDMGCKLHGAAVSGRSEQALAVRTALCNLAHSVIPLR